MPFATLSDVKQHLNKTSTADDDELQDMLDAAAEYVASVVGPYGGDTATVLVHRGADGTVILPHRPVGAVTLEGGSVSGFTVDTAAGLLYGVPFSGARWLTATYTLPAVVPASVQLATVIIAAHLWETQRGFAPSPLAVQDDLSDQPFANGTGFAIPNRAKELLEPYARSSQIA